MVRVTAEEAAEAAGSRNSRTKSHTPEDRNNNISSMRNQEVAKVTSAIIL
jgi:hypothetical protein